MTRAIAGCIVACLLPLAASAQPGGGPGTPASQGPMIVERVHSGLLVAPDFKITDFDKRASELAGGYAGWLTDETFFIGGGGYWLANQARDRKMAYGGLVVQWLTRGNRRTAFAAKGLIGGGRATLGTTGSQAFDLRDVRGLQFDQRDLDRFARGLGNSRVRFREDFFVAEPEVDVAIRLTRRLRLAAGAGYRFTVTEGRDDRRFSGATGSLALQIDGGS